MSERYDYRKARADRVRAGDEVDTGVGYYQEVTSIERDQDGKFSYWLARPYGYMVIRREPHAIVSIRRPRRSVKTQDIL